MTLEIDHAQFHYKYSACICCAVQCPGTDSKYTGNANGLSDKLTLAGKMIDKFVDQAHELLTVDIGNLIKNILLALKTQGE